MSVIEQRSSRVTSRKKAFFMRLQKIDILAIVFFLLVMVRIASGEADSEETRRATAAAVESGDLFKQLSYTILFGLLSAVWVKKRGLSIPRCLGFAPLILLAWILLSSSWAYVPDVSFRRAILLTFVFFSLAIVIDFLGPYKSLQALYTSLGICTVLSVVMVFLVPSVGRHPMTELDAAIAGGWRGIFIHKNTAGAVVAMAAIIFFNLALVRGKKMDWFLFATAFFFVFGSKAKTAFGLFCMVIPIMFAYRMACANAKWRGLVVALSVIAACTIVIAAVGYSDVIANVLADPNSFTGRVSIWQTAMDFGMDHFWFGSGYSSLWGVGNPPPALAYARFPFLEFISHSHNGYIEMFATTGIVGLALAVWFTVAVPFYKLMKMTSSTHPRLLSILFGLWLFGVLENFMETQLFTRDREIWVVYFSSILIIEQLYREDKQRVAAASQAARTMGSASISARKLRDHDASLKEY
jgi:O-antigen ligase